VRRILCTLVGSLVLAACTERLTTPGSCPTLCPGGTPEIRDTVITAVVGGDTAFAGYTSVTDPLSLLVSNGGALGETVSLIRFIPRGDSVLAGDTLRAFTIDSVIISVFLQARDTTVSPLFLDLYRLPSTFDSSATFAAVEAEMTPVNLLRSVEITDSARSGRYPVLFEGAELAALEYTPADSTRLVIGLRVRGAAPAGAYFGAALAGDATPLYVTYTEVDVADTALQHPLIQRAVDQNLSLRAAPAPLEPDLLRVGGFPAARSLVRFDLPPFLRDSATIIRATLELVPDQPVVGIPGDSARIDVRGVLTDFGAKSPVTQAAPSAWFHPGTDTVRVEVAPLVALWQGGQGLPNAVRVSLGQEFASFLAPRFRSTRSGGTGPRLRITYRPPYGVRSF
jgi:hypothetical protein